MLPHLLHQFERLENARTKLFTELQAGAEASLHARPQPEAWSINEIIHHLVLAESFAVAYLEKKLDKVDTLSKVSWSAGLRSLLLSSAMHSPLKFKAPSPLVLPTAGLTLQALGAQWQSQREKLRTLLARVKPEMARLALYRHPVAGLLTVAQMLSFLETHYAHHEKQIARILATRAPAASSMTIAS